MREEFEKMVQAGKLDANNVESLLELTTSGYCEHRSWGFGKITTVDTVFAKFVIDFDAKPGHQMDLGFAADSLRPIAPTHILARKSADLEGLRKMAALQHLELIKVVLESYGGSATVDQIQKVLVPDIITDDWRKWWEAARKEMKKDGHFRLPTKKTEPIVYQEQQMSVQERLLEDFKKAKGLKARINIATELHKSLSDLTDVNEAVKTVVTKLDEEIASHAKNQQATALEAIFIRDELMEAAKMERGLDQVTAQQIWAQNPDPVEMLAGIPAAKHKKVLQSLKEARADDWAEVVQLTMNLVPAKQAGECALLMIQNGRLDELKETLGKLINHHTASSELLLWLCKNRSDSFADIMGPEVFRAGLSSMERDQFNEVKSNRLGDFFLDDSKIVGELISSADLEVVKDITRALKFSPVFDDMDKRSLLARIVKKYPSIQSIISGDVMRQDNSLIVSWDSLEQKRKEYEKLVQRKIPANRKDIAIARSYGDLRENHEYKAAKEMQKVLMSQKAQLEIDLSRARGTDFLNVPTDTVGAGNKVTVTDLTDQHTETYSILGAWDSNPDKGVISYLSPIAQSLLNQKQGTEVEFELQGKTHRFRIEAIEPAVTKSQAPDTQPAAPLGLPEDQSPAGEETPQS